MSAECTVNAIGIETGDCERSVLEQLKQSLLPIAVFALALIAGALIMSSLPLTGTSSEVAAVPEAVSSASPLAGAEYWVTRSRLDEAVSSNSPLAGPDFYVARSRSEATGAVAEAVSTIVSPLVGPEYWVAKSRFGTAGALARAPRINSPLAGPEFWVARSRFGTAGAVAEASSIDSPLAGPEFLIARSRSGTAEMGAAVVSSDSPLAGPEYYAARLGAASTCAAWTEALARFHSAKPVDDPANGASSAGEAAFYIAKYGAGNAAIAALEGDVSQHICEA